MTLPVWLPGFSLCWNAGNLKPENPFSLVFQLYRHQFLDPSIHKGLIDPEHLALAGDGTPVRTAAQQRKKRLCDCKEKGCSSCNCKRHYSQPDCNWGWDSHRESYFFGYHLYMYVASDSYSDLLFFLFWSGLPVMICFLFSIPSSL